MDRVFIILSVIGLMYMSVLVFLTSGKKQTNNLLRKQLTLDKLRYKLQSEKLQNLLEDAGVPLLSGNINLIRFGAAGLYLAVQLTVGYIRKQPLEASDLMIPIVILGISSSARFAPLGALLQKLHKTKNAKKDGELISFLRLYENNRMKKRGHTEFSAYCAQVSSQHRYIGKDLNELSQRVVDEGIEKAIDWFCSQFPEEHHFISNFRNIILATESMSNDEEAIAHLEIQGKIISKIASDSYRRRWTNIGSIAMVITMSPSIAVFLMIVVLSMMYAMLVKDPVSGGGLFQ